MAQLAHEQNLENQRQQGGAATRNMGRGGPYLAQASLQRAVGVGYQLLDGNHVAASAGAAQHDASSAAADQLDGTKLLRQNERMLQKWCVTRRFSTLMSEGLCATVSMERVT